MDSLKNDSTPCGHQFIMIRHIIQQIIIQEIKRCYSPRHLHD